MNTNLDPNHCKTQVPTGVGWGRSVGFHQCHRKAVRDGYCKQHHPESEKARELAQTKRWDTENALSNWKTKQSRLEDQIVKAALPLAGIAGLVEASPCLRSILDRLQQAVQRLNRHQLKRPEGVAEKRKS